MNGCAFCILELHGTRFQFGGTPTLGCQDGLFMLKTLLNAHKNHNLPSCVVFADLVKAYDTANHDLLLKVLEKYGTLPKFVAAISTMYTDLKVILKIDKEITEIMESDGLCQGDNMAPVLFLFLMSAAAETLEYMCKNAGIDVLKVAHTPDNQLENCCVRGHSPCMYLLRKLTTYKIYQLLHVDDGSFPFPTRAASIKGLILVHSHLARFGLEVHIGQNGDPSIMECVFFPPPQFFDDIQSSTSVPTNNNIDKPHLLHQDPNSDVLCHLEQESRESENARTAREDAKYDALPETQPINISDEYVTFCRKFKYLGSCISYNLQDDDDIEARLVAANQSMGVLKNVWRNPHLDTYSKYLLFRAIHMNLLLWGCENWSL